MDERCFLIRKSDRFLCGFHDVVLTEWRVASGDTVAEAMVAKNYGTSWICPVTDTEVHFALDN